MDLTVHVQTRRADGSLEQYRGVLSLQPQEPGSPAVDRERMTQLIFDLEHAMNSATKHRVHIFEVSDAAE